MNSLHRLARIGICAGVALVVGAASLPRAMAGPGVWEIAKTAASRGQRVCLPDPSLLMQWEHRARHCTRTIVTSSPYRAELQYSCSGGGFGTSRVQVLTPRSIKIHSQGIADGLPFALILHARRVGDCPARPATH